MLIFMISSVINLLTYQDPQVTQYEVFDYRNGDEDEINFGESKGELVFNMVELSTAKSVPIDPAMFNLVL